MRSRWFHPPVLHLSQGREKRAAWIELFYDLIFVAAFIQLGEGLSRSLTPMGVVGFAAVFCPMWLAWTGLTFYSNRFDVDDFGHRILVILQMFSVGAMAIYAPEMLHGHHVGFSLAFAAAQAVVSILYLRAYMQCKQGREYSVYWGGIFALGASVWALSTFVSSPLCYVLQGAGVAAIFVAPFSRQSRALTEAYPFDQEHLSERYGLLTLIVLGESFVKVLSSLTGAGEIDLLGQALLALLVTICLWWIYFDDVAGASIRKERLSPMVWLFGHMPLQLALVAVGVAVTKAVHFDLATVPDARYRWLLCGSLGLALFSVALIDSVTERRQAELSDKSRVNFRFFSAGLVVLLAPAGGGMSSALFLGLVGVLCVAQVVFDLMMAPFEEVDEEAISSGESIADMVKEARATGAVPKRVTQNFLNAVRAGAPSELRSDLYHFFIDGPWSRLFAAFSFLYFILNVLFAALYLLEPGSIGNAETQSFGDAFFFSVQTLSTIGYGSLSPATIYGDVVATIESAVGLAAVALATGIMFAKASRPSASVLFSDKVVISRRDGVPTLTLRMGNARGTDIVDANMMLSVLKEDITAEGHHLRRLHDLKLVRKRTPVFALSWTVMHVIDETSPLYGANLDDIGQSVVSMVALFAGHDGSYGQTTYARQFYAPEDVYPWHRFVDVLSQLPDGRALVDYHSFHDVVPDDEPTPR